MKKYPIGFNTRINKEPDINAPMEVCKGVIEPKKSIVQVYFPHRGMGWTYYNDKDLTGSNLKECHNAKSNEMIDKSGFMV